MDTKALSELSRSGSGQVTDICLVCRERELRAVLAQVEAILAPETVIDQSTIQSSNEITVEVDLKILQCGHPTTCWCSNCHYCEDL